MSSNYPLSVRMNILLNKKNIGGISYLKDELVQYGSLLFKCFNKH